MGEVATVTSKSMVTIPARLRRKYGIKEGSKLEFVEIEEGLLLVPVKSLQELWGAFRGSEKTMLQAIRELEKEHRVEAKI